MRTFDVKNMRPPPLIIDADTPIVSGLIISASDNVEALRVGGNVNISGTMNVDENLNVSDNLFSYNVSFINTSSNVINVSDTLSSYNASIIGPLQVNGSLIFTGLDTSIPIVPYTLYVGNGTINGVSASVVGMVPPP